MITGIKYSAGKHSLATLGLGEVVVFLFLGVVVTTLAFFVQTNIVLHYVIALSCIFGLLIATMILTNNIRDIKKDTGHRITIAVLLGVRGRYDY